MTKDDFRKKLRKLVDETLDASFDDDEDNSFTDYWELVRDRCDSAADDEDIEDLDAPDDEYLSFDPPLDEDFSDVG